MTFVFHRVHFGLVLVLQDYNNVLWCKTYSEISYEGKQDNKQDGFGCQKVGGYSWDCKGTL